MKTISMKPRQKDEAPVELSFMYEYLMERVDAWTVRGEARKLEEGISRLFGLAGLGGSVIRDRREPSTRPCGEALSGPCFF